MIFWSTDHRRILLNQTTVIAFFFDKSETVQLKIQTLCEQILEHNLFSFLASHILYL